MKTNFNPECIILTGIQRMTVRMACDLMRNKVEQDCASAQAGADLGYA